MAYVLNILYLALVAVASPWLLWSGVRRGKYREGYAEKLFGRVPARAGSAPCVWLHAVSVGEVNLLGVLVKELRRRRPDVHVVLSSTTRTGLELARKKYADLTTFYCPLDFSWACRAAMRRIRPNVLLLAELELWPNLIRAAGEQGAKVAIVNGRLGERSWRGYRRIRPLCVASCGKSRSSPCRTTNTERDSPTSAPTKRRSSPPVRSNTTAPRPTATIRRRKPWRRSPESNRATSCSSPAARRKGKNRPRSTSIVRSPPSSRNCGSCSSRDTPNGSTTSARMLEKEQVKFVRRSQLNETTTSRILLVDAIGELGAWWGRADIAFVGGSFGDRGGQNMIEPAAYGAAVSFGPNTWNFRDIVATLLSADAAVTVQNPTELAAFVRRCLVDKPYAFELGQRAQRLVAANLGATSRTVDALLPLLPDTSPVASLTAA